MTKCPTQSARTLIIIRERTYYILIFGVAVKGCWPVVGGEVGRREEWDRVECFWNACSSFSTTSSFYRSHIVLKGGSVTDLAAGPEIWELVTAGQVWNASGGSKKNIYGYTYTYINVPMWACVYSVYSIKGHRQSEAYYLRRGTYDGRV